jgi:TolB-like protein
MVKPPLESRIRSGAEPTPAEVRAALERVLRSRSFEHASRATDFLRYVVDKTLAGETDQLKGYMIAVHVFGRPPDFDAQADPLVRVEALRLRQRLTEYYAGEGAAEPVKLELPRGAYAVRASYARPEPAPASADPPPKRQSFLTAVQARRARVAAAAAAALLVAAVGAVTLLGRAPSADVRQPELTAELAHRTKILVVPLENRGASRRLDALAAGLSEEIMLRLDDLDLYVIAMQPHWERPGKGLDGVLGAEHSYVLTGSVREHAGGTRVSLRIIEGETGAQIWNAAYDEPPGIEAQPERQAKIAREAAAAAALFGPVFDAELALARRSAHTLELPDCETRYRAFRRETDPALFPEAFACFQSLVTRQPKHAHAWAGLAMLLIDEHVYYSGAADGGAAFARAHSAVDTALELDSTNVLANVALTRFQFYAGDPEFVRTAERTLALDPDNPEMLGLFGILLTAYGDSTHGLALVDRALSLSPQPRGVFKLAYVFVDLEKGEPCKALAQTKELEAEKWFIAHMITAAAAGLCGDAAAAAQARGRLLAVEPTFEAHAVDLVALWRFDPLLRDTILTGLGKAGFDLGE